jgi:hypothetical protein
MPATPPVALTETFAKDDTKQKQWEAFRRRSGLVNKVGELEEVIAELSAFLSALLAAAVSAEDYRTTWEAGGPWEAPG